MFTRSAIDSLSARRALRRDRNRLARELANYQSASDQAELYAICGRHSAEETELVESILNRQAISRMRTAA